MAHARLGTLDIRVKYNAFKDASIYQNVLDELVVTLSSSNLRELKMGRLSLIHRTGFRFGPAPPTGALSFCSRTSH